MAGHVFVRLHSLHADLLHILNLRAALAARIRDALNDLDQCYNDGVRCFDDYLRLTVELRLLEKRLRVQDVSDHQLLRGLLSPPDPGSRLRQLRHNQDHNAGSLLTPQPVLSAKWR